MTAISRITEQRSELRQQLRAARSQLEASVAHTQSHSIAQRLYPLLQNASHIAGYLAIGNEVDVSTVLTRCRSEDKTTYLPVVTVEHRMSFVSYSADTPLVANQYNILEPATDNSLTREPDRLDVVIVPLVGFDACCNRMGMGGGYYDRAFARQKSNGTDTQTNNAAIEIQPVLIGVAYDLQRVETVFPDWWDVPLNYVVTPTEILTRR